MTFCQHPVIASAIAYFKGARAQAPYVGWMLAERVWMMFSGVIVGFWVVRALGPEEFGHFSAASAVAAVFAGLAAMGLETVIVRRLSAGGVNPRVVLFTAASLRLGGSVAYAAICWVAAWLLFPGGAGDVALMAFIVAAATVFRVTDVIGLWFQAENQYGRAARTRILIRVAGDAIRVFLILNHAPAVSFAIAMLLESMVASIVFIAAGRALLKLRGTLDLELARSLFADGRPVMIGALVAAMYARMDQLFLYNMGGRRR
ncbi:MAG: oligosaccharide flippase family protein [Gammaproteobacteria bacterium]